MVLEVIGKVAVVVPVIAPSQLSVAVGGAIEVTSHCPVASVSAAESAIGAVVSPMATFWSWVVEFPAKSEYVQMIVVFEVIGKVAVVIPVIAPSQLSVAVGGAIEVTSHCPVTFPKTATSSAGAVVSPMNTFWSWVVEFPAESVYVQVMVVLAVIGKVAFVVPVIAPSQLSVAVGGAPEVTSHCPVASVSAAESAIGAVVSPMTIFWSWVVEFPAESI